MKADVELSATTLPCLRGTIRRSVACITKGTLYVYSHLLIVFGLVDVKKLLHEADSRVGNDGAERGLTVDVRDTCRTCATLVTLSWTAGRQYQPGPSW